MFYNSLIFTPIFFFDKGSVLCLLHLYSNFQVIPPCNYISMILAETLDFLIAQIDHAILTKVGLSFISLLSLINF